MSQKFNKLVSLLKELFQLDQPDLDFGLYRIMHAKSGEITQFLESDLLPQVEAELSKYKSADKAELEKELAKVIAGVEAAGMNPDEAPKVQQLRKKIADDAVDVAALESEVYDHLFSFFRRYYHEGDFLSKRVYKQGVYAIPYEGEEVKLHWANKDQYYIKTSEYLRDYAFRLRAEDDTRPMRAHFKLVDASEGEHGNVKAAEGKDRVFILAPAGESGHDFLSVEKDELSIAFEYRPAIMEDWDEETKAEATAAAKKKPPAQAVLLAQAAKAILGLDQADFRDWIAELERKHVKADREQADYSRLEAHLRRYSGRNTFDYFIHKDLGGFLKRELDFYIKNEVMHLDDIENESVARAEQYLSKIKVIRKIACKIITFLAQLEDFQKKLWLKKKFVVETNYCITLDHIPEEFYPEISANEAQHKEWVDLFAIDEIDGDPELGGYSAHLSRAFLQQNNKLPIDTRHFDPDLVTALLDKLPDDIRPDESILVHGDNFQSLNLLFTKYQNTVRSIYIDPPYNTGDDDFAYQDNYQHSSWLTMINQLLEASSPLLNERGSFSCSIDDDEASRLDMLLGEYYGRDSFVAQIAYERSGSSGLGQGGRIVNTKEHVFTYSLDRKSLNDVYYARPIEFEALKRYNKVLVSEGNREKVNSFIAPSTKEEVLIYKHSGEETSTISLRDFKNRKDEILSEYITNFKNIFRLTSVQKENEFQNRILEYCQDGLYSADYLVSRGRHAGKMLTVYYMNGQIFVWLKDSASCDGKNILKENKITDHWSHGEIPKADLANEGGVTLSRGKKPEQLIKRLIEWTSDEGDYVLDFFAGSGTTAATATKLRRRFISIDNERYFDEKSLRRLKNVLSGDRTGISKATEWKGGGAVKYIRLESYEDALNNLEPCRDDTQQDLLAAAASQGEDGLKEQYMLRYMLDVETRESPSLLNIQAFSDPTAYKLKVKQPGSDESTEMDVDLLETFNYLIGLTVEHIDAPQIFSAEFERDDEKRLKLTGRLKQDADGPYWFRTVSGITPDGQKTLVIWRKLTGAPEKDNLVLDEWFTRQGYSTKDSEFQLIYVNGDCTLENLKTAEDTWKVRLLEEDFHRLMFDTEGL